MNEPVTPEHITQRLRRYRTGAILADGTPWDVRFIIDGRDGRLVMPVHPDLLTAEDLILWVPAERFESVQTHLDPRPLTAEYDEAKDRHQAYHGHAELPRWLSCGVLSARREHTVWTEDEIDLANPLHADEPRLCRFLNADKDSLRTMCESMVGVAPSDPVAVGVDVDGIDVRTSIGLLRIELPRRATGADDAEAMIRGLLSPAL